MHLLFLTDNFPPEVNAPASRTYEHSREWVSSGEQVTIITCTPNFPKGKVFPGYKNKLWQTEFIDGIKVIRVWTYITANEGFFKRTLDYVSFMVSAVIASFFVKKVDIVIGTSPQFFTVFAAYLVGLFKRKPWVFELRDLWPEPFRVLGVIKNEFILKSLERLEIYLYKKSSLIISVTNSFKADLIKRGVNPQKIKVIKNGVDTSFFKKSERDLQLVEELNLEEKFVLGYIGTHGMAHALYVVLDAAKIIQAKHKDRFIFIFLGDGAKKNSLKKYAQNLELSNVIFFDTVAKNEVRKYWSILDTLIVHLRKSIVYTKVIPSKLFESVSMGVPVLHGVEGESAEIVTSNNLGKLFEPENSKDLAEKILWISKHNNWLSETQENLEKVAKQFDRKKLAKDMLLEIHKLIKDK